MAEFTHKVLGVHVSVADGKELGPDWEPDDKPKPRTKRTQDKSED